MTAFKLNRRIIIHYRDITINEGQCGRAFIFASALEPRMTAAGST